MAASAQSTLIIDLIRQNEGELLESWLRSQLSSATLRSDLTNEAELRQESAAFLRALTEALRDGGPDMRQPAWDPVRELLTSISRARATAGYSPSETATFIFSFKEPLFQLLRRKLKDDAETLADELWAATVLLDQLGLYTSETFLTTREQVIKRQQEEMLELSTPVVKLWDGVLALPMIGTLDSARTQVVMETLLQRIVETGSEIAIIDITGVPQVDTLVAQHLLKTVTAARLMGAECIISGIRPQIAQTIVHLGVDLGTILTKASLADAFQVALSKTGRVVRKANAVGVVNLRSAAAPLTGASAGANARL